MQIGRFEEGDKAADRWRVMRRDSCQDLPGQVVFANDETGEVVMREPGYERQLDAEGKPQKNEAGAEIWNPRLRSYTFPHGGMLIKRR